VVKHKRPKPAQGVSPPGELLDPAAPASAREPAPAKGPIHEAPMPGTPLPERHMKRLKERAKSTAAPRGARGQSDPSVKKK
jgi:hypothetical protein